jgi:hypothetical protein
MRRYKQQHKIIWHENANKAAKTNKRPYSRGENSHGKK